MKLIAIAATRAIDSEFHLELMNIIPNNATDNGARAQIRDAAII